MPIQRRKPRLSHEVTGVLDDLRRIVRVLRESSREAERTLGVSGAQLFALRALASEQALSLNALAERTRTHQSTVSVVVKRLVARGFVKRAASELDARRVVLTLTKSGYALIERAPLAAQDQLIDGLEHMTAKDRRALATSLRALTRTMKLEDELPEMFFEERQRRRAKGVPRS